MPDKNEVDISLNSQVVKRQGGEKIVALIDELGAEALCITKAVDYIKGWCPEDVRSPDLQDEDTWVREAAQEKRDTAIKMSRNVKDYMRTITQTKQFYSAMDVKNAKLEGSGADIERQLEGMSDDQMASIAKVLRGEAEVVPINATVDAKTEEEDLDWMQ